MQKEKGKEFPLSELSEHEEQVVPLPLPRVLLPTTTKPRELGSPKLLEKLGEVLECGLSSSLASRSREPPEPQDTVIAATVEAVKSATASNRRRTKQKGEEPEIEASLSVLWSVTYPLPPPKPPDIASLAIEEPSSEVGYSEGNVRINIEWKDLKASPKPPPEPPNLYLTIADLSSATDGSKLQKTKAATLLSLFGSSFTKLTARRKVKYEGPLGQASSEFSLLGKAQAEFKLIARQMGRPVNKGVFLLKEMWLEKSEDMGSVQNCSYSLLLMEKNRSWYPSNFVRNSEEKPRFKHFYFMDEGIMTENWAKEPQASVIQNFLLWLAFYQTEIPEVVEETSKGLYEAEFPDETASMIAACELGLELYERTRTTISLPKFNPILRKTIVRSYTLLKLLQFSITVREVRWSNSGMFELLIKKEIGFEEEILENIEKDLFLLDATVNDNPKKRVLKCIGWVIKWVSTYDKRETTFSIGIACSLLRPGMQQDTIRNKTSETQSIEKVEDRFTAAATIKEIVLGQLMEGRALLAADENFDKPFTSAIEDEPKVFLSDLVVDYGSVICCRSTPNQESLIIRLVNNKIGSPALAISVGENEDGVLPKAAIEISICGAEGIHAVMLGDVRIVRFKVLQHLLLVRGHWCFQRIPTMKH